MKRDATHEDRHLFKRFPCYRESLSWIPLADLPTRVHRLDRLSEEIGSNVWIKRDDEDSTLYSGNKPRKFEFIFGEARSRGCRAIITSGSMGSNHGTGTALFGRELGFEVLLVLSPQPILSYVRQNILVNLSHQARMIPQGSQPGSVLRILSLMASRRVSEGRWPYFMYFGGSSIVGNLGFVEAGLELAAQVEKGELPRPRYVFVPTGSCGTHAGLEVGFRLAGLDTQIVGVRIVPKIVTNRHVVANLANRTARYLRQRSNCIPQMRIRPSEITLLDEFFGGEYGRPTPDGKQAIGLLRRTEGLPLDPTYTGKAFAGMLDFLKKRNIGNEPVLYWQTLNGVDLQSYIDPRIETASLPAKIRRYFEEELYDPDL